MLTYLTVVYPIAPLHPSVTQQDSSTRRDKLQKLEEFSNSQVYNSVLPALPQFYKAQIRAVTSLGQVSANESTVYAHMTPTTPTQAKEHSPRYEAPSYRVLPTHSCAMQKLLV